MHHEWYCIAGNIGGNWIGWIARKTLKIELVDIKLTVWVLPCSHTYFNSLFTRWICSHDSKWIFRVSTQHFLGSLIFVNEWSKLPIIGTPSLRLFKQQSVIFNLVAYSQAANPPNLISHYYFQLSIHLSIHTCRFYHRYYITLPGLETRPIIASSHGQGASKVGFY